MSIKLDRVASIFPSYLVQRPSYNTKIIYALVLALLLIILYELLGGEAGFEDLPDPYIRILIYEVLLSLLLLFFGLPRIGLYTSILLILITHVYFYTHVISRYDQDEFSTRDDAAEMTSQAFLQGKNPWNHVSDLGVSATTGPASILIALPFVIAFDEINGMSFLFWVLIFVVLLIADIRGENDSFPILALLIILGIGGFTATLFWSLDELYFPMLFIVLSYWSISRGKYLLTGGLLAIPILWRMNYIFLILGVVLWIIAKLKPDRQGFFRLLLGAFICTVIFLLPFFIVGGQEFFRYNPISMALTISEASSWPTNNLFFRALNFLGRHTDPFLLQVIKVTLICAGLLVSTRILRNTSHPFWLVAIGALLTQTIAWFSGFGRDYQLLFVLPAFIAVAYTPKKPGLIQDSTGHPID